MGYKEEQQFVEETEHARDLLVHTSGSLLKRIAAAKRAGDLASAERFEKQFAETTADERKLVLDPEYRKAILAKYPPILEALGER